MESTCGPRPRVNRDQDNSENEVVTNLPIKEKDEDSSPFLPAPKEVRVPCEEVRTFGLSECGAGVIQKWMVLLFYLHIPLMIVMAFVAEMKIQVCCWFLQIFGKAKKFLKNCKEVFINNLSVQPCLSVTCKIDGELLKLLIDTGSQVSVVCSSWYRKKKKASALREDSTRLRCVGGSRVSVDGVFNGKLSLGGEEWDVPWLVADIGSGSLGVNGILGMDVLARMRGVLDLEKRELILPGSEAKCWRECAQLGGSSILESGKCTGVRVVPPEKLGIFEPDPELMEEHPGLLVARVVADRDDESIVIPVKKSEEDIKETEQKEADGIFQTS